MSERRRPRADDDYLYPTYLGIGSTTPMSGPDDKPGRAVGRLIIPDPEQRHGWRESYVYRDTDEPKMRRIGFRR